MLGYSCNLAYHHIEQHRKERALRDSPISINIVFWSKLQLNNRRLICVHKYHVGYNASSLKGMCSFNSWYLLDVSEARAVAVETGDQHVGHERSEKSEFPQVRGTRQAAAQKNVDQHSRPQYTKLNKKN
jgi:hypothetical protein